MLHIITFIIWYVIHFLLCKHLNMFTPLSFKILVFQFNVYSVFLFTITFNHYW